VTERVTLNEPRLRRRLVLLDALALGLAWLPAYVWKLAVAMPVWKLLVMVFALMASGLITIRLLGLHLARVASSRTEEVRRIVRCAIVLGFTQVLLLAAMGVELPVPRLVFGPVACLVLLLWFRGGYRAWLGTERLKGRFLREVVVIGTNDDAADLVAMLREHPESGYAVVGVVGDAADAVEHGLGPIYLGTLFDIDPLIDERRVSGVIAVAGALPARVLSDFLFGVKARGVHVQLSNGLMGMSPARLRATPVAFQSLYYLEPADEHRGQQWVKRVLDVVLASLALVVLSPVMAAVALAVKLTDGGPILFGQTRVGRDGELIRVWKFRSMVVDAEARLAALQADNERNGPLFKLEHDPRVTRVGRFIRSTSLDELPQLFNVLRGDMSVVGPRPALPSEVAQFDDRLLDRLRMRPGITGLWQVEARDNPHFGAYRRLDLFYVDNWSLSLDIVVLVATVEQVLAKAVRSLFHASNDDAVRLDLPTATSPSSIDVNAVTLPDRPGLKAS
jgi:exopolysaccharide biosynthesis polyprenyl glycosylphosphotransferase